MFTGGDRPTLRDLNTHVVQSIAPKWRDLGIMLGISHEILKDIEVKCHGSDQTEFCRKLLIKWLQIHTNPSWNQLIGALKGIECDALAKDISSKILAGALLLFYLLYNSFNYSVLILFINSY